MILSGEDIKRAIDNQERFERASKKTDNPLVDRVALLGWRPRIKISPFDPKQINPNSYDLRLGTELLVYDLHAVTQPGVLDCKRDNPTNRYVIPESGFVLMPGVLYLGTTIERTATHNLVPCIEGRSSLARLGCATHISAGWGDVGYGGEHGASWTLELTVVHPLRIYAGIRICQIAYTTVSKDHVVYSGKYNADRGPAASRLFKDFEPTE